MWHVIIAIQGLIIHIKQGEASLSFACLRLYAFEKSFPQGVRMALIPKRHALPPPGAFTSFQAPADRPTPTQTCRAGAPRQSPYFTSALGNLPSEDEHTSSLTPSAHLSTGCCNSTRVFPADQAGSGCLGPSQLGLVRVGVLEVAFISVPCNYKGVGLGKEVSDHENPDPG